MGNRLIPSGFFAGETWAECRAGAGENPVGQAPCPVHGPEPGVCRRDSAFHPHIRPAAADPLQAGAVSPTFSPLPHPTTAPSSRHSAHGLGGNNAERAGRSGVHPHFLQPRNRKSLCESAVRPRLGRNRFGSSPTLRARGSRHFTHAFRNDSAFRPRFGEKPLAPRFNTPRVTLFARVNQGAGESAFHPRLAPPTRCFAHAFAHQAADAGRI